MFFFTNKYKKLICLVPFFLLVIAVPQSALAREGQGGSATGLKVQASGPITANIQAVHINESSIGPFHTTHEVHNVSLLGGDITAGKIAAETIYAPSQNQVISLALANNLAINLDLVPLDVSNLPLNLSDAPLGLLNNLLSIPLDLLSIPLDLIGASLNSTDASLSLVSLDADNITSAASINGLGSSPVLSGGATFKGLTLNILGIPVTVPPNPDPNTELLNTVLELDSGAGDLVNATAEILAIANEQIISPDNTSITVNSLHIKIKLKPHTTVNGGALSQDLDIVVAQSYDDFSGE